VGNAQIVAVTSACFALDGETNSRPRDSPAVVQALSA